jgi:hypothetical protein
MPMQDSPAHLYSGESGSAAGIPIIKKEMKDELKLRQEDTRAAHPPMLKRMAILAVLPNCSSRIFSMCPSSSRMGMLGK